MPHRLAVLTALAGCSLVTMSGPPPGPLRSRPECESRLVVPAIDALASAAVIGVGALMARSMASEGASTRSVAAPLVVGISLGVAFASSSVIGARRARGCARARDAWATAAHAPTPGTSSGSI